MSNIDTNFDFIENSGIIGLEAAVITYIWQELLTMISQNIPNNMRPLEPMMLNFLTSTYCTCMHIVNYHAWHHSGLAGFISFHYTRQVIMRKLSGGTLSNPIPMLAEFLKDKDIRRIYSVASICAGAYIGAIVMEIYWDVPHCGHGLNEIVKSTGYCDNMVQVSFWMGFFWEFSIVLVERVAESASVSNSLDVNNLLKSAITTGDQYMGMQITKSLHSPARLLTYLAICPGLVKPVHAALYTMAPLIGYIVAEPIRQYLIIHLDTFENEITE